MIDGIESKTTTCAMLDEEKNKEATLILKELENIDDECDALNVDFVKISDPGVAPAFKLTTLPALVYFRRTVPIRYSGDLMDEEAVLVWVTSTKEQDADIIEEVDDAALEQMLEEHVSVVVYFCKFVLPSTSLRHLGGGPACESLAKNELLLFQEKRNVHCQRL